jgi:AP-2 complex subunit alpha
VEDKKAIFCMIWKMGDCHYNFFYVNKQVKGVKPLPLPEMANLFMSLHLAVAPGLVRIVIFVSLI